ncbi:alpha-L-fucosidase-like [Liolophura sinensis]|uniref:alpha-L-fucosidase-like n=1 Tax=Liolophura sinensis TaxID=3198878 RepID=UPI003158ADB3
MIAWGKAQYQPNWESLDSRPLPDWYDDAKIGIFIHWGVFSVPSVGYGPYGNVAAWFWQYWKGFKNKNYVDFMNNNYPPGFTYADFAPLFKAELFDPDEWAELLQASGARYVVLTSKHAEGFTNWQSEVAWNWNSVDTGPHRDLVADLAAAVRGKTDVHFGLYHCLYEWFHPYYVQDKKNNFTTNDFPKTKAMPELYEIVKAYKPDLIFSDGDWEAPDTYWNSTNFLAWLYNESPVKDYVVVNDRWGMNCSCTHGGYYDCKDRYNPGSLQKHKWENAMTIDRDSWGYRRNAALADYLSIEEILATLAMTVSTGGNMLMNVGPSADGRINPIFEERLRQMGQWLGVNGEAIYKTKPWVHQNDTRTPGIWYTTSKASPVVYVFFQTWPDQGELYLGAPATTQSTTVSLIGYPGNFTWDATNPTGINIYFPAIPYNKMPCLWGWIIKLENLAN